MSSCHMSLQCPFLTTSITCGQLRRVTISRPTRQLFKESETVAMAMGSLGWASTTAFKVHLWKKILPHTFNYRHNTRRSHSSSSSDLSATNWGTQLRKRVTAFASGMGEIGGGREQVSGLVRASSSSAATTMKGDQQGEDVISFLGWGEGESFFGCFN